MSLAIPQAHFAHPARNVWAFGIEPGMKVADFGAGSGAYVFALAEHMEGSGVIYAVDIQKDLLRRIANEAKKRGFTNVEVVWGDVDKPHGTSIADKHVDAVLVSNLLFQLENPAHAFAEAKRILKPGGTLIVIDWSDSFGGMGPAKKHVFTQEKAEEFARKAGFEKEREFEAGEHHYGLLCKVPVGGFSARTTAV